MRTITQAAEELNVSRKKIYNEIEKLNIKTQKEGKNNYLIEDDFERIKVHIEKQTNNVQERLKNVSEHERDINRNNISDREYTNLKETISFLQDQLKAKDEQLKIKDEQIKSKDYQISGLIQSTFNFSKMLNPPTEQALSNLEKDEKKVSWFKSMFKKKSKE